MRFNAKIGLGAKKNCFGPLKMKKNDFFWLLKMKQSNFSKNQNSQIWWTIGGGQDSATGHPDTFRTFGSIRFI